MTDMIENGYLRDLVKVFLCELHLNFKAKRGNYLSGEHRRIEREKKTIEAMVHIYCRAKHGMRSELCRECTEFLAYAKTRLDECPFQEQKSTCRKCLVHCYKPDMRENAKLVMHYSGPRMLLPHPILSLQHLWDGTKKPRKLAEKP